MLTKGEKQKRNRPLSMRNHKILQLSVKSVLKVIVIDDLDMS